MKHAFAQDAVLDDDVGGVAGHEQTTDVRADGHEVPGQATTVHLQFDHDGHKQFDLPLLFTVRR